MRALVHGEGSSELLIQDVPDPVQGDDQVLIDVRHAGINFLDIVYRDANMHAGDVPGVDAAGVVRAAAADGSGPPVGTRVTSFGGGGAWAELRAVSSVDVARVPDAVPLDVAAALPGAGVTALQCVRLLGPVLGRRVLVTGASGGVGRFTVQLAAQAGAEVIALVGSPARGDGLTALGAHEVVTSVDSVGTVDHAVDLVGGEILSSALRQVERGGRVLAVGQASLQPSTFDFEAERRRGGGTWLTPFTVQAPFGPDLAVLLGLVERGVLDPVVGWRRPWDEVNDAADALMSRRLIGKAVMDIA